MNGRRNVIPTRACFTLAVLFWLGSTLAAAETAPGPADDPPIAAAIELFDLWAEERLAHQHIPGVSIGLVHDQELVWAEGYGFADLESRTPATPETLYRLGSITKLFTATAVLQLRDAAKLTLDDPVVKHLPWFSVQTDFEGDGPITVRQLLTHTSGLPREAAFPYWTTHEFPTSEDVRKALPGQQAVFGPARRYKYSNLGMGLLGEIVGAVSGQTYADYVRDHILLPLGMNDSTAAPTEAHHKRRATSYMRRLPDGSRPVFDYYDTRALAPAANLVSSVRDLAEFAKLQFRTDSGQPVGGAQILAPVTVREMHRPHWVYESWRGGRGLGFSVSRRNGKTVVSHGGWIGGNRTHLLLVPSEKIAVIAMVNADDASPSGFSYEAYDVIGTAIVNAAKTTKEPTTPKRPHPEWQRYVGVYTDPWHWEYRVLVLDGELVFYEHNYPPEDDAESSLTRLEPRPDLGPHTFRMADGELIVFELDDEGRVERIRRRYEYLTPVAPKNAG